MKMCGVHKVAWILVIVGALNWGLVGAFNFNLVNTILGAWPTVERIVYVLVGLSAVSMFFCGACKACKMGGEMKKM
ncbi:DUF378 domain-containing protein [Candidatus Uhrbacteria bacterium]|nr:DUF378 domain-containing protein [Candidatus Uhrbacteria bacterium]